MTAWLQISELFQTGSSTKIETFFKGQVPLDSLVSERVLPQTVDSSVELCKDKQLLLASHCDQDQQQAFLKFDFVSDAEVDDNRHAKHNRNSLSFINF